MKSCAHCGKMTLGEPLFCGSCGRSYDVRLCPRLHVNPRQATFCSQCGAHELSKPQPRVSIWRKALEFFLRLFSRALVACLLLLVLLEALTNLWMRNNFIVLGFLLAVLWWLWSQLPDWIRKLVRKSFERRRRGYGQDL
jgi:hypothetical protein